MQNSDIEAFLCLSRLGIGNYIFSLPQDIEWTTIQALATQQGLTAVVLDGVEVLKNKGYHSMPTQVQTLQWIGDVLQSYESRYRSYKNTIAEMANFYNSHGLKMMVLKGYSCGLDWPKPEHRPCGDIDIWLFGKQKEADAALDAWFKSSKVQEFKIDKSHHHHTVFYWNDFMVENHYDFINVHSRKPNIELENIFKELGKDDSHFVELNDDASTGSAAKVYLPSPNLHALFLMRHLVAHFTSVCITLRQVLDWGFFVEKHTKEIDWEWLDGLLVKYQMKEFVGCINAICVEDLGFSVDIFPEVQFVPELKERVLKDILDPEYTAAEPKGFLPRLIYKYKRWQGNAWKQRLCYNESRWSTFWYGVWNHLLKPSSI